MRRRSLGARRQAPETILGHRAGDGGCSARVERSGPARRCVAMSKDELARSTASIDWIVAVRNRPSPYAHLATPRVLPARALESLLTESRPAKGATKIAPMYGDPPDSARLH